jgi:OOP family OmpA-OmpF porin
MMKRTVFASLAALAICSPALAIDKPADATVGFNTLSTAYPSSDFNQILESYGLSLSAENVAVVPKSYASAADGKISFNEAFKAYNPVQYHSIFTAYGLELSPEDVSSKLGISSYATVKDGEVVFGSAKLAFNGEEWEHILAAYSMPAVPAPAPVMPMDSDGDGVIDANDDCPGTPSGVVVDERGCWALSSNLLFDHDSAVIKADFYPVLDKTTKVFNAHPQLKVIVEGHANSKGPEVYNQKLSERRAKAVVDYLVNKAGVSAGRLDYVGKGELSPAYSNDTEMGLAKNRRVEFTPMQ